jgi:hypothetical protein
MAPDHPLAAALAILRELYGSRSIELPIDVVSPFAPCWGTLAFHPFFDGQIDK